MVNAASGNLLTDPVSQSLPTQETQQVPSYTTRKVAFVALAAFVIGTAAGYAFTAFVIVASPEISIISAILTGVSTLVATAIYYSRRSSPSLEKGNEKTAVPEPQKKVDDEQQKIESKTADINPLLIDPSTIAISAAVQAAVKNLRDDIAAWQQSIGKNSALYIQLATAHSALQELKATIEVTKIANLIDIVTKLQKQHAALASRLRNSGDSMAIIHCRALDSSLSKIKTALEELSLQVPKTPDSTASPKAAGIHSQSPAKPRVVKLSDDGVAKIKTLISIVQKWKIFLKASHPLAVLDPVLVLLQKMSSAVTVEVTEIDTLINSLKELDKENAQYEHSTDFALVRHYDSRKKALDDTIDILEKLSKPLLPSETTFRGSVVTPKK